MEDTLQLILKKLTDIDSRLKTVENAEPAMQNKKPAPVTASDALFEKAVNIIREIESEISTSEMQKKLGVDAQTAEKILDQLAAAGYGTTYMGEA